MKKLFIMMAAACFLMFTACNNNKPADQPKECTEMQAEDHPCCKDMPVVLNVRNFKRYP